MGILGGTFSILGGITKGVFSIGNAVATSTTNGIYTAVKNAKTNKEIKKVYQQVSDSNYENRGVTLVRGYQSKEQLLLVSANDENDIFDCNLDDNSAAGLDYIYGSSDELDGVIVSGGKVNERMLALIPFLFKAKSEGIPVFAIHSRNSSLEQLILNWGGKCDIVSQNGNYYDAFRGMPTEDIVYLLYESMPENIQNPNAESLLRALVEVQDRIDGNITIKNLTDFPLNNLQSQINSFLLSGILSKDEFDEINGYYMAGISELNSVRVYLKDLCRQAESVYGKNNRNRCNIKGTLNSSGVACIDIGVPGNATLLTLVLNHMKFLQSQGIQYAIILDEIPISKYDALNDILLGSKYAISCKDFISSISGGKTDMDSLFSQITGSVTKVVLFSHSSGNSCKKWSEYMGTYNKIRIKSSISRNDAFMNSSFSSGLTVDEKDEPRVRPETIQKLAEYFACIYSADGILFAQINEPN